MDNVLIGLAVLALICVPALVHSLTGSGTATIIATVVIFVIIGVVSYSKDPEEPRQVYRSQKWTPLYGL